jgi:hypothetical protein
MVEGYDNPCGAIVGPLHPMTGGAGSFAWVRYEPGDHVLCPGDTLDRRFDPARRDLGERRQLRRSCGFSWGRAGEGSTVFIRKRPLVAVDNRIGQLVTCPKCRNSLQVRHVYADTGRAA